MTCEEDWLMRPVLKHLCSYESLKNGTIDLLDITKMNEALDVEIYNTNLLRRKD